LTPGWPRNNRRRFCSLYSALHRRIAEYREPPGYLLQGDEFMQLRRIGGSRRKRNTFKRYLPVYLMMLPGLVYIFINNYMPLPGLMFAFQNVNFTKGIFGGTFVGLKNFEFLFRTSDAWIITRNTLLYNLAFLTLGPVLGITVAIFLNEMRSKFASRFSQTTILLPNLMSMVIISYLVYAFFSKETGFINNSILPLFGVEKKISWYSEAGSWPAILIFVHMWRTIGFSSVIYLSALVGIDKAYYEAADLDGANKLQQILHITLPFLKPTVITLTILGLGQVFRSDFGLFYQVPMNSGMLYKTTNTIDTYVFRGLMQFGNLGMSSAAGFYQSIVGFITILSANYLVRWLSYENRLF
jgi:putative aldouronate transport system permease protein